MFAWMRSEGSTTDVVDLEGKMECTPEVPVPPGLECSGKGWWTMLGWEGADPDACVGAGGGVESLVATVLNTSPPPSSSSPPPVTTSGAGGGAASVFFATVVMSDALLWRAMMVTLGEFSTALTSKLTIHRKFVQMG